MALRSTGPAAPLVGPRRRRSLASVVVFRRPSWPPGSAGGATVPGMSPPSQDAPEAAHRLGGLGAAVGAMVGWGLGPVFVKFIHLPGLVLSFHRLWIGAIVGVALLTARGGRLSLRKI